MLLHREVGMFVALGGGARHLKEAMSRIEGSITKDSNHPACKCIVELEGRTRSNLTRTTSE